MTAGDEGKLFTLFLVYLLSPYSARLCAPCVEGAKIVSSIMANSKPLSLFKEGFLNRPALCDVWTFCFPKQEHSAKCLLRGQCSWIRDKFLCQKIFLNSSFFQTRTLAGIFSFALKKENHKGIVYHNGWYTIGNYILSVQFCASNLDWQYY